MKSFISFIVCGMALLANEKSFAESPNCGGQMICVGAKILALNSNFKGTISKIEGDIYRYSNDELSWAPGGMVTSSTCKVLDNSMCMGALPPAANPYPAPYPAPYPQPQPYPQPIPVPQPQMPGGVMDSSRYLRIENLTNPNIQIRSEVAWSLYSPQYPDYYISAFIPRCREQAQRIQNQNHRLIITKFGIRTEFGNKLVCDIEVLTLPNPF